MKVGLNQSYQIIFLLFFIFFFPRAVVFLFTEKEDFEAFSGVLLLLCVCHS